MNKLFDLSAKDAATEFGDPIPADAEDDGIFVPEEEVSGLGVENTEINDEEEENNISEMLKELNSSENAEMLSDMELERKQREEYLKKETEDYEKRMSQINEDYNRKRYEAEQAAKAERLKREEEERLAEEEEERKAKEATFLGKLSKAFKKKEKPEKEPLPSVKTEEVKEPETVTPAPIETVIETAVAEEIVSTDESSVEEQISIAEEIRAEEIESPQSSAIDVPEEVTKPVKAKEKTKEKVKVKEKPSILAGFSKILPTEKKQHKENKKVASTVSDSSEPDWKFIALHDDMTGLLNSRAYHEDIKNVSNNIAIVFFDINNLKYVNDTFGHTDGDELIRNCSSVIAKHFGNDRTYRIGGDEFVSIIPKKGKGTADKITEMSVGVHNDLKALFKASSKHVPHAVSIGYAVGDGKVSVEDIIKVADASMYKNKKAYKISHPDYNIREKGEKEAEPEKKVEKDHDELLSMEQKALKDKIQKKHSAPSVNSLQTMVRDIQKRSSEIKAILIADPNFNHLFVITEVNDFFNLINEGGVIDYSYLYVVWEGGSQYYGTDEYYNEVTDLFKEIAEGLLTGKFRSEKDIRSIKGINIFRSVYV